MSDPVDSCHFDGIFQQKYIFRDWNITARRSHILESKCSNSCPKDAEFKDKCLFCQYEEQFKNIPHFPDMTFAKNLLHIENKRGFGIGFDCLNALKSLSYSSPQEMKVDSSEDWLKARADCEHTRKVLRPFDWTFTTNYKGHFLSDDPNLQFKIEPTEERINIERLKVKDDILFFDDVHLFEDELADNGVAQLSVKIRVMRDIMFILLRYFLRVDKVKVRLCDTRIYYEAGKDYLLREFTSREQDLTASTLSTEVLLDPVELSKCLPLKDFCNEKLIFPK